MRQRLTYTAHDRREYDQVSRAVSKLVSQTLSKEPAKLLLGPCIALVNVKVVNVVLDHTMLTLTLEFVETPVIHNGS